MTARARRASLDAAVGEEVSGGAPTGAPDEAPAARQDRRLKSTALSAHLPSEIDWRVCRFGALSPVELARIYRARQLVFTIEQQCIYLDADEYDELSCHIAAWSPEHALPLAYARLVNPGTKYTEPSMGRVITTAPARGLGLGRELVRRVIAHSALMHPGMAIRISAQERLARLYADFGFAAVGSAYLEDGIPHLEMLRPA